MKNKIISWDEWKLNEENEEHSIADISSIIQRKVNDWQQLFVNSQLGIEKEKVDKLKEHFINYIFKAFSFIDDENTVVKLIKMNFIRNFQLWGEFPNGVAESPHILGALVSIVNALFSLKDYI